MFEHIRQYPVTQLLFIKQLCVGKTDRSVSWVSYKIKFLIPRWSLCIVVRSAVLLRLPHLHGNLSVVHFVTWCFPAGLLTKLPVYLCSVYIVCFFYGNKFENLFSCSHRKENGTLGKQLYGQEAANMALENLLTPSMICRSKIFWRLIVSTMSQVSGGSPQPVYFPANCVSITINIATAYQAWWK